MLVNDSHSPIMRYFNPSTFLLSTLLLLVFVLDGNSAAQRLRVGAGVTIAQHQIQEEDGYSSSSTEQQASTTPKQAMQHPTLNSDAVTDSTDYNLNFDYSNVGSVNSGASSSSVESTTGHYYPGAGIRKTTLPSSSLKVGARHFGNRVIQSGVNLQSNLNSVPSTSNSSVSSGNSIHDATFYPRQSQSVISTLNSSQSQNSAESKRRRVNTSSTSFGNLQLNYHYEPTTTTPPSVFGLRAEADSPESTINTDPPATTTASSHYVSPAVRRKHILMGIGLRTPRPTKYVVNAHSNSYYRNAQGSTTTPAITSLNDEDETTSPSITTNHELESELETRQSQSQSSQLSITNHRVRIRLPTVPPTQPITAREEQEPSSSSSAILEHNAEHLLPAPSPAPPPAPSPSFEFNPSVTIKEGLYHYRYTVPELSSKRVHTQEFGITQHSYGEDEDEHDDRDHEYDTTTGPDGGQQQSDDITSSPIPLSAPDEQNNDHDIQVTGSEDESSYVLQQLTPIPLDTTGRRRQSDAGQDEIVPENQDNQLPLHPVKRNSEQVTVTVTVTSIPSPSESKSYTVNQHQVSASAAVATPALPTIYPTPSSTTSQQHEHRDHHHGNHSYGHGSSTEHLDEAAGGNNHQTSNAAESDQAHTEDQQGHHNIQVTPAVSAEHTENEPVSSSRDFKTIYYTSTENPNFTSGSYSFSSSQEYSFHTPHSGNDDGDDGDHTHHDNHHHELHDDHNATHVSHQTIDQHVEEDSLQRQQQIHPTTSTYSYWDTLGLKSVHVSSAPPVRKNDTGEKPRLPKPSPLPVPESGPTTHAARPTVPSPSGGDLDSMYSTPQAAVDRHQLSSYPPISHSTSRSVVTMAATTSSSGKESDQHVGVSEENEVVDGDDVGVSGDHPQVPQTDNATSSEDSDLQNSTTNIPMLLPVPVFVKISLQDVSAAQFCSNIEEFKDIIVKIYAKNQKSLTSAQIVVHNQPSCSNATATMATTRRPYSSTRRKVYGESSEESQMKDYRRKRKRRSPMPVESIEAHASSVNQGNSKPKPSSSRTRKGVKKPTTYYYVYIYVTDKNGTYDQSLTETFVAIWNISGNDISFGSDEVGVGNVFSHKITTVEMITSTTQSVLGQGDSGSENSGIIIAIAVASSVAACLLIAGIFLLVMRHRQTKTKFAKRCTPVTLDDYSLDNISVFNSFRRKQRGRASKRSYTNAGFEDPNAPSRPLNAAGLATVLTTESASISDEFSNIPNVNPTLDDIPAGAEAKNRYANVIPVPDTRVLLTFQDEQQNSDYINANFVRGANSTNKSYIITQGPLDETIVEFWRMIWEQQVRVIFMLTDFSESGIPKCAPYYPRSETIDCSQLHGDFQITLEKRDIMENCITSYLVLKDMERSLRRDIIHCWYHTWPEKGVPSKPTSTIDFLMKTRKFTKESFPIVVHCSPGTGRSGAIVACDIGMKELDGQRQVDVPQIVRRIRQDRAGAVQTKEQYKHIYEVLSSYASKLSNNASSTENSRSEP